MPETHVHPVPSDTTLVEDVQELRYNLSVFYERHHTAIMVLGVLAVSVFMQRRLLRRELKRLDFVVDVYSFDADEVVNSYGD